MSALTLTKTFRDYHTDVRFSFESYKNDAQTFSCLQSILSKMNVELHMNVKKAYPAFSVAVITLVRPEI